MTKPLEVMGLQRCITFGYIILQNVIFVSALSFFLNGLLYPASQHVRIHNVQC